MLDHPTALLGPPKGPILAQKGPFGGPGGPWAAPGEPDSVPSAALWSNWFGLIVTTYFDLVLGPFVAAKGPKRPLFGQKAPFRFYLGCLGPL